MISPSPVIVMLGDVGGHEYHVGDEAMLDANRTVTEQMVPEAQIIVLGQDASPARIKKEVAGATAALVSGGGNMSNTWPQLLEQRLVLIEECMRSGIPVAVTGQTIGPELGEWRERVATALRSCRLVGVREVPTRVLVESLGVDSARIAFQPDDAFGLRLSPPRDSELVEWVRRGCVAVTLDGSFGSVQAAGALRALTSQVAEWSCAAGLPVLFIPHLGPIGATVGTDGDVGRRVVNLLALAGATARMAPVLRSHEAAWLSANALVTVSSRYHPIVFATAAGRPAVGLHRDAYTRAKIQGALEHVEAGKWCLETAEAERGALAPMLESIWGDFEAVSATIANRARVVHGLNQARQERMLQALGLSWRRQHFRSPSIPRRPARPPGLAERTVSPLGLTVLRRDGFLVLDGRIDPAPLAGASGAAPMDETDALHQVQVAAGHPTTRELVRGWFTPLRAASVAWSGRSAGPPQQGSDHPTELQILIAIRPTHLVLTDVAFPSHVRELELERGMTALVAGHLAWSSGADAMFVLALADGRARSPDGSPFPAYSGVVNTSHAPWVERMEHQLRDRAAAAAAAKEFAVHIEAERARVEAYARSLEEQVSGMEAGIADLYRAIDDLEAEVARRGRLRWRLTAR